MGMIRLRFACLEENSKYRVFRGFATEVLRENGRIYIVAAVAKQWEASW